jgi:hypothetical protein
MGTIHRLGTQGSTDARDYLTLHHKAVQDPRGIERAIVSLRAALLEYGLQYGEHFEGCEVGGDGVLGVAWFDIARGYLELLNGPTGRLDCGTLDGEMRRLAKRFGFEEEL